MCTVQWGSMPSCTIAHCHVALHHAQCSGAAHQHAPLLTAMQLANKRDAVEQLTSMHNCLLL
eukprot:scaffold284866_cov26-Tisochrysis_lutea.AAC.2